MRGTHLPATVLLLLFALALAPEGAEAQRHTYTKGQPVYPAYEGWVRNDDGSIDMLFGYMNENWEEAVNVPVGADNRFSPVQADQGQPTHFLPRRNRFTFTVRVPPGFGADEEIVWTLRANGHESQAFGTLREDLYVDNVVIMSETGALGAGTSSPEIRANIPPMIELEGERERTVRAGEQVTLVAMVTDDGQPDQSSLQFFGSADDEEEDEPPTPQELLQSALRASTASVTVSKRLGLHFTWFVYRGPGETVEFDSPQIKPWEDTRPFANSPWARAWSAPEPPEDNRWVSEATFSQPGTYVLRGRADDGGLYSDVEVTVEVRGTVF
ncbi:MAG: hypothetical protein OEO79_04335 [Gemmatimonadota bacterium]|nr:hypothetical protein [Gemmatimonadota bacterium]MDH3421608.1 hypothetical protein [Gemmatimonadota bacterium]